MPNIVRRERQRFTELRIKKLVQSEGIHHDGGGLYLVVRGGARNWVYRYSREGKAHTMGLGRYPDCTLGDARRKVEAARNLIHGQDTDPLAHRHKLRAAARIETAQRVIFDQCAKQYIEAHRAGWRNAKHADQWSNTLATYASPIIGMVPVSSIDTGLVMKVLSPVWSDKTETANRVRGRIEAILDWAKVNGFRDGENPARWRGHLDKLLPKRSKVAKVEHHAALPYGEVAAFLIALRGQKSTAALALEFTILTAARTSETIGATWAEFNLPERVWIVPGNRMKAGKEHRVPLCDRAIAILNEMAKLGNDPRGYVFPGRVRGKPLSNMAMAQVLRRMGRDDLTVHGFRSTFRDWAAEQTTFPSEVAEMALAHAVSDKVEAAYRRGDMFDRRRALADEWCVYCG